jgi:hypothetical protein
MALLAEGGLSSVEIYNMSLLTEGGLAMSSI